MSASEGGVPEGMRRWTCPECGQEQLLSVLKLDPLACDRCLQKYQSGTAGASGSTAGSSPASAVNLPGPWGALLQPLATLPVLTQWLVVLIVGAGVGFAGGYHFGSHSAGNASAPPAAKSGHGSAHPPSRAASSPEAKGEDRSQGDVDQPAADEEEPLAKPKAKKKPSAHKRTKKSDD